MVAQTTEPSHEAITHLLLSVVVLVVCRKAMHVSMRNCSRGNRTFSYRMRLLSHSKQHTHTHNSCTSFCSHASVDPWICLRGWEEGRGAWWCVRGAFGVLLGGSVHGDFGCDGSGYMWSILHPGCEFRNQPRMLVRVVDGWGGCVGVRGEEEGYVGQLPLGRCCLTLHS